MKEELKKTRKNSEALSAKNARLASTFTLFFEDLAKVKTKVEAVKTELESLCTLVVSL